MKVSPLSPVEVATVFSVDAHMCTAQSWHKVHTDMQKEQFYTLKILPHTQEPYGLCLKLLTTSPLFSLHRAAESQTNYFPMSWHSGTNLALGNPEPRGIQRLKLFRQYLQCTRPSLRAVNTNQLSPECDTYSLTDLTVGQLGENEGAEHRMRNKRLAQSVTGNWK